MLLSPACPPACRDSANEELIFTLDRNGERLQVPVTPSQSGDGTGRVGIQLASNSKVLRKKAGDPLMVRRRLQLGRLQLGWQLS
jgi:hypothetical protein